MFKRYIRALNPGWDSDDRKRPSFTDTRQWQRDLKARGIELISEVDERS